MIYGRLSEAEQARRDIVYGPGYPFIEHSGKLYRITELVQTAVGHANYQAVEADSRERDAWLEQNKPKPTPPPPTYRPEPPPQPPDPMLTPPEEIPEYVLPVRPPEPPPSLDELVLPPPPPPDVPTHSEQGHPAKPGFKPRLADFARTYGAYKGFGRIPKEIVEKYKQLYGDPPPLSEAAKKKKEEFRRQSAERYAAKKAARRASMIPTDEKARP